MGFVPPPSLPKEHGAWTMLAIPMLLGLAAGGARSGSAWHLPPSIALVFLAHHAIVPSAQRALERRPSPPGYAVRRLVWGAIYLASAASFFALALLAAPSAARGPCLAIAGSASALAAAYAGASVLGYGRALVPEALGLAGVSLNGPMIAAAAGRIVDRSLFGIAVMAIGYFLSSVAFVRAYEALRVRYRLAVGACLSAHLAIAAGLGIAAWLRCLPHWWWIAFVPVVVRTASGLARPAGDLRQLGLREAWVAASFTALAAADLAYHA
jgi:hypothetical protein